MKMTNQNEESPAAEHRELVEMLSGLQRVDAPGDFYFRVKAGIAKRSSSGPSGVLIPAWLKYAAPLALIIVVGLYFGSTAFRSEEQTATVAESVPVTVHSAPETSANAIQDSNTLTTVVPIEVSNPSDTLISSETNATRKVPQTARRRPVRPALVIQPAGGSVDQALRGSSKKILPRGLSAERVEVPVGAPGFERGKKIAIREVLSLLGIEAEPSATGWTVTTTRADSPAQRSGLMPGDVIESIGNQRIGRDTLLEGSFSGSVMSIRRDGRPIVVNIRNK